MPWEIDGRQWHTKDRVDRKGNAVHWDGRVLERVVDRIHELGEFSETDWKNRSIVEIAASKKSDGWFFHAITAETWLLKMKSGLRSMIIRIIYLLKNWGKTHGSVGKFACYF